MTKPIMSPERLKYEIGELAQRITALDADAKPVREQLGNIDRQRAKLAKDKADLERQLSSVSAEPRVSDHAVIRYLERMHGFSFEAVRKELLTPAVVNAMRSGVGTVRTNRGTFRLKDCTIVTVID
jgi:hypothetical protein